MKDHIPTVAALIALGMVLATVLILTLHGQKPGDMAMLGLGTAIGTIVSGFSPSFSSRGPSQVINAGTANTSNELPNDKPSGQKEEIK